MARQPLLLPPTPPDGRGLGLVVTAYDYRIVQATGAAEGWVGLDFLDDAVCRDEGYCWMQFSALKNGDAVGPLRVEAVFPRLGPRPWNLRISLTASELCFLVTARP